MPKWTNEQQEAIDKDGSNIIVSAGAGSGKTAVLTARVIRKLESGVNIDDLLILTFTNAAAKEMKERIRSAIEKNDKLTKQLDLIDGAYITTFDSFSLSLVKKYHYLLGINKNINIVDSSIIYCKKQQIIDYIFEKEYENSDEEFNKIINDFCIKDDKEIKKYISNISSKLDLLYDKDEYLDNYIDTFYDTDFISKNIRVFEEFLLAKIEKINSLLGDLSYYVDVDYMDKINEVLFKLLNSSSYNEISLSLDIRLPNLARNADEGAKSIKEEISKTIKELNSICIYEDYKELESSILSTKPYIIKILSIIKEIDKEITRFKLENNVYEFNDISKMAIKILEDNQDVCLELKDKLNEIMVDEYQDTSDLQEKFISLIQNDNVYMVGDIKQSIYRFRNANPYIFKNKYDNYSSNLGGYKIDLNKNFRSRGETLNDINVIFNIIMDDAIGGADYKTSHQMVFGNSLYTQNDVDSQNNSLEIYNYEYDKGLGYSKDEIECFAVATDIKNKVDNKYQVFDKETSKLRDVKYSDFVILMDRATKFDLYKKIFEYLSVPLTKYTDTSITDSNDILIIKNIIALIIKNNKKEYDVDFKYSYTSIARSYLFRISDEDIYKSIKSNNYDSSIMNIVNQISSCYDSLSISGLINLIIDRFDVYNKLITVGNIQDSIIRLEYIYNLANNVEGVNYSIEDFYNYLDKLIDDNYDIKVSMSEVGTDSVKIMTIHKSKGLEYPVCYYTGVYAPFNISDVKEKFIYDKSFGIISPYFKEGIAKTFYNHLYKDNYIKEEISEKIRLFYVALTRCREKMIVVAPLTDKAMTSSNERFNYRSFLDILNSVYKDIEKYITNINIKDINITHEYDLIREYNYKNVIEKDNRIIESIKIDIDNTQLNSHRYSKNSNKLVDSNIRKNMKFGTYIHCLFEMFDFKNGDVSLIDSNYRKYLESFLNCGIDFLNCNIYKEYEFVYNVDNTSTHGIIDLMLEYDNYIKIIDYKLNNIDDDNYVKQLNGYKEYIENRTGKTVYLYLYSILNSELKEIKR